MLQKNDLLENLHLFCTGLGIEGIFRVNGNARIVEKLKTSFDLHGDANLDEDNDVLAVAGVLKQFLREMTDSVVPEQMTRQFVTVQEGELLPFDMSLVVRLTVFGVSDQV